jgi:hypothetical protein
MFSVLCEEAVSDRARHWSCPTGTYAAPTESNPNLAAQPASPPAYQPT